MAKIDYSRIELLVLDVDGVLTDGRVILMPTGEEIKQFCVRDGSAIKWWHKLGKKTAIISGRDSPAVALRAKELGIELVHLKALNKLPVYEQVLSTAGVSQDQTAVMGDDLPDLPLLCRCALPAAPADAAAEVRQRADFVSRFGGGQGAVRELIELILKKSGQWEAIVNRYLPEVREGGK